MTTLYLCRECALLLGELADPQLECENCRDSGPHIPGEFSDTDAETLLNIGNPEPTV